MNSFEMIGSQCLTLHLRRASRRIGRLYDDALRPAGLTNGQFSLMTMLAAKSGWTMQELADALGLDQSSLTAAIKPLARRELVETSVSIEDRRARILSLTATGRALAEEASLLWKRAQEEAERLVEAHSPDAVRSALRALS